MIVSVKNVGKNEKKIWSDKKWHIQNSAGHTAVQIIKAEYIITFLSRRHILRAIVQITHGWKDYIERNEELIRFFTDHGIMVCGCDFICDGRSAGEEEWGHLEEDDGWVYLVKDVKRLTAYIRKEYPQTPFFLYGHGMGSLVARLCCLYEPQWDGVILSGTSGRQKYCRRSVLAMALLRRIRGVNHRSKMVEKMIYRRLNRKFRREKEELSWFSEIREQETAIGQIKVRSSDLP